MTHPMHESVISLAQEAIALMDDLLRFRIELVSILRSSKPWTWRA